MISFNEALMDHLRLSSSADVVKMPPSSSGPSPFAPHSPAKVFSASHVARLRGSKSHLHVPQLCSNSASYCYDACAVREPTSRFQSGKLPWIQRRPFVLPLRLQELPRTRDLNAHCVPENITPAYGILGDVLPIHVAVRALPYHGPSQRRTSSFGVRFAVAPERQWVTPVLHAVPV